MSAQKPRFGLILPNRGVVVGATSVPEMLTFAAAADRNGWDSVWVGDSVLAKPRLDALVLLSALAARTTRVRLGPACMASTPLRQPLILASQWASLDVLSGGRTVFVACQGQPGPSGGGFEHEYRALGIDPSSRMGRMEEAIEILRLTSLEERATFHGQHYQFDEVSIEPRPVQRPLPIWIAVSPALSKRQNAERAYRRVARYADGWMTTLTAPDDIRTSRDMIGTYAREQGRVLSPSFEVCLYCSINVNEDRQAALEESKRFLDSYYGASFAPAYLEQRVAIGSPAECVERLRQYLAAGVTTIALRLAAFSQEQQFRRVTDEVIPALV